MNYTIKIDGVKVAQVSGLKLADYMCFCIAKQKQEEHETAKVELFNRDKNVVTFRVGN